MNNIKVKKLNNVAVIPTKATDGSAGFDLYVTRITTEINEVGELIIVYHSDIAVEIPDGYVGLLFMRSSVCKKPLCMCNAVGVIDSDFRGEITGKFRTTVTVVPSVYKEGERFCQLLILPVPDVQFEESDTLSETDRGEGGYGSTDNINESAPTATQSLPETEVETTNSEPANEAAVESINDSEEA